MTKAFTTNEEIVMFEDPVSGRWVQFAVNPIERNMVLDIPFVSISQQEYEWLRPHMAIIPDSDGTPFTFQKEMSAVQIDYAAQYVEWVFTKIFLLPVTHDVTAQIFT